MTQRALFPMKSHRISADYKGSAAHRACSQGTPHDYPTDLIGHDSGRDWFRAPCDLIVLRRYTKASHAIWMRSLNKVKTPYGTGYLYIMVEHQDNSEMKGVGEIYRQGRQCFREGKNGNATGYHLHVSCGFSKTLRPLGGTGWKKNSRGAWVLYIPGVKPIKIDQAFYKEAV